MKEEGKEKEQVKGKRRRRRRRKRKKELDPVSMFAEFDQYLFSKSPSLRQRHKLLGILEKEKERREI